MNFSDYQSLRGNDGKEESAVEDIRRELVLKERDPKTNGKDDFSKPGWATNGSSAKDNEEGRVFIRYKPKAKGGLKKDMDDLDAEDEAASPGQSKKFDVKYEFDDLETYVVVSSKGKLKSLMNRSKNNIVLVEDDPIRELVVDPLVMEETLEHAEDNSDSNHRNLQTSFTDQLISGQWRPYGVSMVQAPQVWPFSTGAGVKVCVIDSGIYRASPDFVTANLSGDDTSSTILWSQDTCKHGTHCSGTIAGKNDSIGVVGVAYDAKIHSIRVFSSGTNGCGWSYASGLIGASNLCKAAGAKVISMSLGGSGESTTERDQFQSLYSNDGILSVAAAGNGASSAYSYPASYPSVMSVAAVDSNSNKASFSQYNDQVDIAAPGVATKSVNSGDTTGNNVLTYSGTSMATPHVAAVAALLFAKFSTSNPKQDVINIRNALQVTAQDRGTAGRDDQFGHGIVKAYNAYQCLSTGSCVAQPPVTQPPVTPPPCTDSPVGWYDIDGPTYSCSWYAQGSNCASYGNSYANFGKTANQACCVCGGGVTGPVPSPVVVPPPTKAPTRTPSRTPSRSPSKTPTKAPGVCVDNPQGWYDIDGPTYSCPWYAQGSNCASYGSGYANFGKTANQACCACGGGLITTCTDNPVGWYDIDGPTYSCAWYAQGSNCASYGNAYANFGKTANQACCVCGGGSTYTGMSLQSGGKQKKSGEDKKQNYGNGNSKGLK